VASQRTNGAGDVMATKDGRHFHVSPSKALVLAYGDCPCWPIRGYTSALTPIPGPADEAYAAALTRLRVSGVLFDDPVPRVSRTDPL